MFAIDFIIKNAEFNSEVVNIANGKEISIKYVSGLFYEIFNPSKIVVKFGGEERKGDPINWCADIGLLKTMDYKQRINIDEGLKRYVQWLKEKE